MLAGIMTTFGAPTGAVAIDGNGEFDGVMLASFSKPRIEGRFRGDRLRAWDVVWGQRCRRRRDREQLRHRLERSAHLRRRRRFAPTASSRSAIRARTWARRSTHASGSHGGRCRISATPSSSTTTRSRDSSRATSTSTDPTSVRSASARWQIDAGRRVRRNLRARDVVAALRGERRTAGLDLEIAKSSGTVTGAAFVGWEGNYSFNADGSRIPVESLKTADVSAGAPVRPAAVQRRRAPGRSTIPRYDVKLRVDDLFAGDEGIGQLNGRLSLRGELLTLEMEAASPRLVVSGSGRIALTPEMDAELTVRFADTSLDPYVRFFEPRLSPFTTAVAGGTIRVDRRARRRGPPGRRGARREPRPEAVRLLVEEQGHDRPLARPARARRSISCSSRVKGPSCRCKAQVDVRSQSSSTCRPQATPTSGSCRASTAICAAAAAPRSRRRSAVRSTSRCSPASADITDGRVRMLSVPQLARGDQRPALVRRRRRPPGRRAGEVR